MLFLFLPFFSFSNPKNTRLLPRVLCKRSSKVPLNQPGKSAPFYAELLKKTSPSFIAREYFVDKKEYSPWGVPIEGEQYGTKKIS